jgi:hypothetical protein
MFNGIITKDDLHKANDREHETLIERFYSEDFQNAVANYLEQKMLKNKL